MAAHDKHEESYSVYLGWTSYKVEVSQEGYKQIIEVVRATAVCEDCKRPYGAERPNVAGLLCLYCFSQQDRKGLTFQGPLDPALSEPEEYYPMFQPYERGKYLFLDEEGHVYITEAGPGANREAKEDIALTLKYWRFPRPTQAERNGQTVNVSQYGWSIYGDVKIDDVLMLQHGSKWHGNETLFVAKRDGKAIQINRRKPMHRALLAEARAEIEATKTPGGTYLINGEYHSYFNDGDVYRLVARRVGAALAAEPAEPGEQEQREEEPGTESAE